MLNVIFLRFQECEISQSRCLVKSHDYRYSCNKVSIVEIFDTSDKNLIFRGVNAGNTLRAHILNLLETKPPTRPPHVSSRTDGWVQRKATSQYAGTLNPSPFYTCCSTDSNGGLVLNSTSLQYRRNSITGSSTKNTTEVFPRLSRKTSRV